MTGMPTSQVIVASQAGPLDSVRCWDSVEYFNDGKKNLWLWAPSVPMLDSRVHVADPLGSNICTYFPFSDRALSEVVSSLSEWLAEVGAMSLSLYGGPERIDHDPRLTCASRLTIGFGGPIGLISWSHGPMGIRGAAVQTWVEALIDILGLDAVVEIHDGELVSVTDDITTQQIRPGHLTQGKIKVRSLAKDVRDRLDAIGSLASNAFHLDFVRAGYERAGSRWEVARNIATTATPFQTASVQCLLDPVPSLDWGATSSPRWCPVARWTRHDRVDGYPDPAETNVTCAVEQLPGEEPTMYFYSNDMRIEELINDVTTRTGLDVEPVTEGE